MSALLAEQWFQALRRWHTRTVRPPRPRPWKPRGPAPLRRPGLCPVCRSARVDEYEARIERAIITGENLKPVVRQIAEELGVHPRLVHLHASSHMLQEPPPPLVGEWVASGIEYLETPAGWIPSTRVMAAIRANPESQLLLEAIRGHKQTLLNKGYFRDEKSRRIGRALLQIDSHLRFPQFVL